MLTVHCAAEFRGPGIRNQFEEAPDDYDLEMERSRGFSVRSGRIILLGDGTEIIPDQNEEELFDQTEEDQDLANQVQQEPADATRNQREDTPGPQVTGSSPSAPISESPASTADADTAKPTPS